MPPPRYLYLYLYLMDDDSDMIKMMMRWLARASVPLQANLDAASQVMNPVSTLFPIQPLSFPDRSRRASRLASIDNLESMIPRLEGKEED